MVIERESGLLHYEAYGQGDVVIFLNGFATGCNIWYPVIKDLKDSHQCVLYEYIGTGQSASFEGYDFSLDSYCSDLDALITHLGNDRIHIVGYSMGGWIAQYYVTHWKGRLKSLSLINSSSRIFSRQSWVMSHLVDVLRKHDLDVFSKLMFLTYYSPEYFEKYNDSLLRINNLAVHSFAKQKKKNLEMLLESCLYFDCEAGLGSVDIPVMLVSGEHDFFCPRITAQRLHSLFPNIEWIELKSVGHAVPMECFDETREIITNFIRTVS